MFYPNHLKLSSLVGSTETKGVINSVSRVADDEMICQERFMIKSNIYIFFFQRTDHFCFVFLSMIYLLV